MTDKTLYPLFRETLGILHVHGNALRSSFVTFDYLSSVGSLLPHIRSNIANLLFVLDDPAHPAYAEYDHLPEHVTHLYKDDAFSLKGPTQHIVILDKIPGSDRGEGKSCFDCALAQYLNQQLHVEADPHDTIVVLNAAVRPSLPRKSTAAVMGMTKVAQSSVTLIGIRGSGFVHANVVAESYSEDADVKKGKLANIVLTFPHQYPDYELVCDWGDSDVRAPATPAPTLLSSIHSSTAITQDIISHIGNFDYGGMVILRGVHGDAMVM